MGIAARVITGRVTNPGATLTALTMNTGDSATLPNWPDAVPAYLEQIWSSSATPGVFRVRSPRLHDQAQGIRLQVGVATPRKLVPQPFGQVLYPADQLTLELSGGGAETDLAAFLVYFEDLPGVSARLARWEEIQGSYRNVAGVEVSPVTSATAGQYGTGRAIDADFDTFKSGRDYALLGYLTDVPCGVVGIVGPDTGNTRVGGPGADDHLETYDYFARLARDTGRPYIPVIAGNNAGATLVDVADPATSTTIDVTLLMAELGS